MHAGNNVAFTNGSIDATAHTGSSNDAGGTVEVKAFNGGVTGTGSIQARGDGLANPGSTDLISCAAVTFAGTIDPAEGNVGNNTGTCGGAPSIPSTVSGYIVFHPEIWEACNRPASFSISGTKHKDTLQGAGLPGWTINLYNSSNAQVAFTTTDASGQYVFNNLPAGTYKVCEVILDPSWQQIAPNPGTATCTGPNEATQGYQITLGPSSNGNDFANTQITRCEKQPVQQVLDTKTGRYPGNKGPDVFVILSNGDSIQNAIDTVTDKNNDNYLLIQVLKDSTGQLGGSTNQRFTISKSYDKTFGLIGCSNTLVNPDPSTPTELITASAGSPGNIFVMDVHGSGSNVAGVEVDGTGRELRNVYANSNNGVGYWITGDGNTIHNGQASSNKGDGVYITSNGNTMTDTDLFGNGGNGVNVVGSSNQLLKLDAGDKGKGNTGDGIHVVGDSNLVSEPGAFANGGDGIDVFGASNTLTKPVAGDKGKGNGGDGIRIAGAGNSVTEGKASANKGIGYELSGGTAGSPNVLSKDVSNTGNSGDSSLENGSAEFKLLNSVRNNGGGNKADNIVVPKTSSPVKCATFPNTNVTGTFGAANVCE